MIKVSVLYPNKEGSKFDMGYYLNSHIPMVQKKCGASLKGGSVDQGLNHRRWNHDKAHHLGNGSFTCTG